MAEQEKQKESVLKRVELPYPVRLEEPFEYGDQNYKQINFIKRLTSKMVEKQVPGLFENVEDYFPAIAGMSGLGLAVVEQIGAADLWPIIDHVIVPLLLNEDPGPAERVTLPHSVALLDSFDFGNTTETEVVFKRGLKAWMVAKLPVGELLTYKDYYQILRGMTGKPTVFFEMTSPIDLVRLANVAAPFLRSGTSGHTT